MFSLRKFTLQFSGENNAQRSTQNAQHFLCRFLTPNAERSTLNAFPPSPQVGEGCGVLSAGFQVFLLPFQPRTLNPAPRTHFRRPLKVGSGWKHRSPFHRRAPDNAVAVPSRSGRNFDERRLSSLMKGSPSPQGRVGTRSPNDRCDEPRSCRRPLKVGSDWKQN